MEDKHTSEVDLPGMVVTTVPTGNTYDIEKDYESMINHSGSEKFVGEGVDWGLLRLFGKQTFLDDKPIEAVLKSAPANSNDRDLIEEGLKTSSNPRFTFGEALLLSNLLRSQGLIQYDKRVLILLDEKGENEKECYYGMYVEYDHNLEYRIVLANICGYQHPGVNRILFKP